MKSLKIFAAVAAFSMLSFGAFAQSVSVTGPAFEHAEAQIAAKATELRMSYKINSAQVNNRVHMTAVLTK